MRRPTTKRARYCDQCGAHLVPLRPARGAATAEGQTAAPAEADDRRVVTALFADLVDYVRMIAEHDPEEVRARVGAALRGMADTIERLDGTREKFIGNAVFALFGWPRAHDDDPVRASLAALAIRASLREPVDGGEPLEVRIGLATGEVVAGSRVASVIGIGSRDDELADLLERPTPTGALDRLAEAALVVPLDGGVWRFSHPLVHDAAYAGLLASRRRRLHARLADRIEAGVRPVSVPALAVHRAAWAMPNGPSRCSSKLHRRPSRWALHPRRPASGIARRS